MGVVSYLVPLGHGFLQLRKKFMLFCLIMSLLYYLLPVLWQRWYGSSFTASCMVWCINSTINNVSNRGVILFRWKFPHIVPWYVVLAGTILGLEIHLTFIRMCAIALLFQLSLGYLWQLVAMGHWCVTNQMQSNSLLIHPCHVLSMVNLHSYNDCTV